MPNYCMVSTCMALSGKGSNRMFHMLPRDPQLCATWLKALGVEDDIATKKRSSYRVCSDHFEAAAYETRRVLRPDACPSLRLGPESQDDAGAGTSGAGTPRRAKTPSHADTESVTETGINLYDADIEIKEECLETNSNFNDDIDVFEAKEQSIEIELDMCSEVDTKKTELQPTQPNQITTEHKDKLVDSETNVPITETGINHYDADKEIKEECLETNSDFNDDIEVFEAKEQSKVDTKKTELKTTQPNQITTEHKDKLVDSETNVQTLQFLAYCQEFLGSKSLDFVKCQMLLKRKNTKKFDAKFKLFCLNLYYNNPRAYEFLKQLMTLPSIKTLRKIYVSVHAGYISPQCLQIIESMLVKMNAKNRCCVVAVGSTNIRKHVYYDIRNDTFHGLHQSDDKQLPHVAKKAYVLVLKGLYSEWRLPIAYALFGEYDAYLLVHWVDTVIETLMYKGFNVLAFISNQDDADFKRASQLNGISRTKSFFRVMEKKIYHVFDVRHLLRRLRDSFMSFNFVIGTKDVAKWDHILTFYKAKVELQTQLAPKLTDSHLHPDAIQQNTTVYAAQLFSQSLATGMELFVRMKLLDERAVATVKLIRTVNDLYDLLNSNKLKHNSVYKRAYTGEQRQKNFLQEVIEFFQTIKKDTHYDHVVEEIEAIEGFIVTMKSVKDLWKDLQQGGYTYLLTRSLSLEFVEDFFRKINAQNKAEGKQYNEFTSVEFNRAFYKLFVADIIENSKLNKEKRIEPALSKLNEYIKTNNLERDTETRAICVGNPDYRIRLPTSNIMRFIAGYLIRKALDKHRSCKNFMMHLTYTKYKSQKFYVSYQYLEDNSIKTKSVILSGDFIVFVMKLEERFLQVFRSGRLPREVGAAALTAMADLVFLPCRCFPLLFIKKLFIRLRIYNTLKVFNKRLKDSGGNLDTLEIIKLDL